MSRLSSIYRGKVGRRINDAFVEKYFSADPQGRLMQKSAIFIGLA